MFQYFIMYLIVLFGDGTIFTVAYHRMTGYYWWVKQKPSDSSLSVNANGIDVHLVGNPIEAVQSIFGNIFKPHTFKSRLDEEIGKAESEMLDELMKSDSFKSKVKELAMRKIEKQIEDMAKPDKDDKNE